MISTNLKTYGSFKRRNARGNVRRSTVTRKNRHTLSRGTMVSDICLVIVWAASIPGLMWLGAAGGF